MSEKTITEERVRELITKHAGYSVANMVIAELTKPWVPKSGEVYAFKFSDDALWRVGIWSPTSGISATRRPLTTREAGAERLIESINRVKNNSNKK